MEHTLARVLNTVAHEIRTPLAVSQGYVRLFLEGRLAAPDEQRSAFERVREALGVISNLCSDIGGLAGLADAGTRPLTERAPIGGLMVDLETALTAHAAVWRGSPRPEGAIASTGAGDLVKALAAVGAVAFAEARHGQRVVDLDAADAESLTVRFGGEAAVASLPASPDDALAAEVPLDIGGHGMAFLWAAFVLQHHHVRMWQRADGPRAIAVRLPLVNA
jgi:signal transduction histidine kinase